MERSDRERFLHQAIQLAHTHMHAGHGGPFGAVIVRGNEIVGEGWNRVTSTNDPTAHAEVSAIRDACKKLGSFLLRECTLYTNCEPCPMCLAASYWARLDGIYYSSLRGAAAEIGFDDALIYEEIPKPVAQRILPMHHLPLEEAQRVFADWKRKADKIAY